MALSMKYNSQCLCMRHLLGEGIPFRHALNPLALHLAPYNLSGHCGAFRSPCCCQGAGHIHFLEVGGTLFRTICTRRGR